MHLKKVHEFIAKKGKPRRPSSHKGAFNIKIKLVMNAHILNDAQSILQ
jgi:hypothetical protein